MLCSTLLTLFLLSLGGILKLSSDLLHPHSKTVRFASDATLAPLSPKAGGGGSGLAERLRRRAKSVPDLSSSTAPRLQPVGATVGLDLVGTEWPSCPLTESLFPGLPSTIHFPVADEECECGHKQKN